MPVTITFYGLTCFQKLKGKDGYLVWLPDGRDATAWGIPTHVPHLRVGPYGSVIDTNWAWQRAVDNNYVLDQPCDVSITGIERTKPNHKAIEKYIQPLKQAGSGAAIASSPKYIACLPVVTGRLEVQMTPRGMRYVEWVVEPAPKVEPQEEQFLWIRCGSEYLKVRPSDDVDIVFCNTSLSKHAGPDNHYRLYRKLVQDQTEEVELEQIDDSPPGIEMPRFIARLPDGHPLKWMAKEMPGGGCSPSKVP